MSTDLASGLQRLREVLVQIDVNRTANSRALCAALDALAFQVQGLTVLTMALRTPIGASGGLQPYSSHVVLLRDAARSLGVPVADGDDFLHQAIAVIDAALGHTPCAVKHPAVEDGG